mmetsp:Transcript_12732/g.32095  ORF Transcript_12732/g.32095 Transcript_12732/m.32095 type:complete len:81 (+) Transcript_12732:890-1132(+)
MKATIQLVGPRHIPHEVRFIQPGSRQGNQRGNQRGNQLRIPLSLHGESQLGNQRGNQHQDLLDVLMMLLVRPTQDAMLGV